MSQEYATRQITEFRYAQKEMVEEEVGKTEKDAGAKEVEREREKGRGIMEKKISESKTQKKSKYRHKGQEREEDSEKAREGGKRRVEKKTRDICR